MNYFVFCTFDLKNGTANDYKNAYADLEKLGLKKVNRFRPKYKRCYSHHLGRRHC